MFKKLIVALVAVALWHSPMAAQTPHPSCAAKVEQYTLLQNDELFDQNVDLQQLSDVTATTIELLGFSVSADRCSGPEGTALICDTADKLLIELDHQYNQIMEGWQGEAKRPPLLTQIMKQYDELHMRYARACIVRTFVGKPA